MILDINGNAITSFSFQMEGGNVVTFKIKITCKSGYTLWSELSSNASIEGKHEDDVSYVDIVTTGIPLDPWDATEQIFDIRLTSIAVVAEIFDAFKIYLG